MLHLPRRGFLAMAGATALATPRLAFAQGARPRLTIAVQKLATSNALDPLIEQSNVGARIMNSYLECLIGQDYQGTLSPVPRLATQWRRIDDSTVELDLRQGVMFHNGDEMTAEDVAFSFSPDRMFGDTTPEGWDETIHVTEERVTQRTKELPPQVPAVSRRLWPALVEVKAVDRYTVRFVNATPDVTMEGRIMAMGSQIINRRAFEEAESWLDFARQPIGTGPYKVASFTPDVELVLVPHEDYYGCLLYTSPSPRD